MGAATNEFCPINVNRGGRICSVLLLFPPYRRSYGKLGSCAKKDEVTHLENLWY